MLALIITIAAAPLALGLGHSLRRRFVSVESTEPWSHAIQCGDLAR